jgi:ArsR family transcriptional regulator
MLERKPIDQVIDACCAPLDTEPLTSGQADVLARGFKAVADPIRLLSLIASTPGGEAYVCDLTGAFALTGPLSPTTSRSCGKPD